MSVSFQERYAQAIRSANLTCDANTTFSDLDVIGAMAWADKRLSAPDDYKRTRLGAGAVCRLLAGDDRRALEVVEALGVRLTDRFDGLSSTRASDIARACIGWLVHGRCRQCGGNEARRLVCRHCQGSGRVSFSSGFSDGQKEIARWLMHEIAADLAIASTEALEALAPRTSENDLVNEHHVALSGSRRL